MKHTHVFGMSLRYRPEDRRLNGAVSGTTQRTTGFDAAQAWGLDAYVAWLKLNGYELKLLKVQR